MRRPGWTAGRASLDLVAERGEGGVEVGSDKGEAPEEGGAIAAGALSGLGRLLDDLEDRVPRAGRTPARGAGRRRLLADAAQVEAGRLQRHDGAVEGGADRDDVVEGGDAVGMRRRLARRRAVRAGRRQAVELAPRPRAATSRSARCPRPRPPGGCANHRPRRRRPRPRTPAPTRPRAGRRRSAHPAWQPSANRSRHPVGRRSTRFDVSTVALRNRPHGDRRERRWPPSAQIVAPARRGAKAPKLPAVGRVSWRPSRVTRASQNSAYERRGCRSYTPTRSPLAKRSAPFPYADHHADNLVAGAPATASARSARCRERGGRRGRRRKHGPDQDLAEPPGPDPSAAAPHRLARRPSPHRLLRGVAMGPVALPVPHTYS